MSNTAYKTFAICSIVAITIALPFQNWVSFGIFLGVVVYAISHALLVISTGFLLHQSPRMAILFSIISIIRVIIKILPFFAYLFIQNYGILIGIMIGLSLMLVSIHIEEYLDKKR